MKNDYLIALLKENKTVIVPGLGAFIVNDSKTIPFLFNEYLKFDDGLVVSYVATQENISREDAGKKIEVFSSGIKSLLDSGRDVVFTGVGKIKKDEIGKLVFTADTSVRSETTTPVNEEKKVAPVVVEKPIEKESPPLKETPPVKENKEIKVTPELKKEDKPSPPPNEKKEKPKEKIKESKKEKTPKEPKKKKRIVLWIVLLVLLGGGGTTGFIFKDQIMTMIGMHKETAETNKTDNTKEEENKSEVPIENEISEPIDSMPVIEETSIAETKKTDNKTVKTEVKKPVVKKTPVSVGTASSGTHYVIVGCFNSQYNADNMLSKVNASGNSGSIIGNYGGLYFVSAYASSDRSTANQKANELRSQFTNAWVFSKR